MANITMNRLTAPTYRWLKVNEREIDVMEQPHANVQSSVPEQINLTTLPFDETYKSDDNKSELFAILSQNHAKQYVIAGSSDEPARFEIRNNGVCGFCIQAENRQHLNVIMQMHADCTVYTGVHADAGAQVKLVQFIYGAKPVNEIHAELSDDARFELVQIYLNTENAVTDIQITMNGRKSEFTSNIGYLLANSEQLDLNLNVVQKGRKCISDTDVKGVLRDQAKKTFRGTIDFQLGAIGAKGAEKEDVLLMGSGIVNQTVPVILCAEEDVEGAHGASIGQIDAEHVFYLQSRGLPAAKIYELIAQSKLNAIVRRIGDQETEHRIMQMIGRDQQDE
ncbi:MAG TPA: hypothetical protein DCG49_02680 [Ruminococcus sp.]|nr:hypothetical protein [Ruminococcus sp.]